MHNAFCGFAWYYLSTLISFMRKPSSFLHSKIFVQIVHLFQLLKSMMSNICQSLKYFIIVNYLLVNVKSKYLPSDVNLMRPLPERKWRKKTFPPCHVHWWESWKLGSEVTRLLFIANLNGTSPPNKTDKPPLFYVDSFISID